MLQKVSGLHLFLLAAGLGYFISAENFSALLQTVRISSGSFRFIHHLPYITLILGGMVSWHFRKTRITLISTVLAGAYFLAMVPAGRTSAGNEQFFQLLSVVLCLNLLFFQLSGDRGIASRAGMTRVMVLIMQFLALLQLKDTGLPRLLTVTKEHAALSLKFPGTQTNFIVASLILATLILLFLQYRKHKDQSPLYLATTLILAFASLNHDQPWIAGKSQALRLAGMFSLQGLTLITMLYSMTWGRVFTDALTGLYNRRTLDDALPKIGGRYTVTMIDIDHFKKFNDTYGHQAGDEVLQYVAEQLKACGFGTAYRYGGEEFIIVSQAKPADLVVNFADALRRKVEASSLILSKAKDPKYYGKRVSVTLSLGISQSSDAVCDPSEVIRAADAALYRAKKKGRNRVEIEKRSFKR
ncbi:MAG: GGDEF domain-containing protein [Candidatus Wallbacteria bacterium]|nr:GGDEF domain-containing protein [Candidatus Wallbacteria bacterium]